MVKVQELFHVFLNKFEMTITCLQTKDRRICVTVYTTKLGLLFRQTVDCYKILYHSIYRYMWTLKYDNIHKHISGVTTYVMAGLSEPFDHPPCLNYKVSFSARKAITKHLPQNKNVLAVPNDIHVSERNI